MVPPETAAGEGRWIGRKARAPAAREAAVLRIRRAEGIHHEADGWFGARVVSGRAVPEMILVDVPVDYPPVGVRASRPTYLQTSKEQPWK